MNNAIKTFLASFALILFAPVAYAANPLNAQIAAPKSPTNQTDLTINVVVLDQNQVPSISVQCYWQKNGGSWNALGAAITVIPGGNNTANCQTSSNQINEDASYGFYATATDGTNNATTQTVSVNFTRNGPGTPTNYAKNKNNCAYQISLRTADDGGKTVKVEVYRSTNTSFSADGSTKIGQISVGSNTDSSYTDNPPDCGANYYYAIRAFDAAGNGSGVVGDSQSVTVATSVSRATGTVGAIPAGTNGNVLGAETGTSAGQSAGEAGVLGEATPSAVTPAPAQPANAAGNRTAAWAAGILLIVVFLVWLLRQKPS